MKIELGKAAKKKLIKQGLELGFSRQEVEEAIRIRAESIAYSKFKKLLDEAFGV